MTYIKEVELDNFKSFAGHNKFIFIKGFNIIAGANGSGKSNIIDAIMFVLGGSSKKEMRSEVLTDLIFNGGKGQKPADFAKVTVIFDNSDKTFPNYEENELSISRKIDESGKSIFRINGKASTREEILNILSVIKVKQDSFNIIPQGKISEIAASSPEERLGIINDLSGISVFEEKKAKAMNEMKKVEENTSKIDAVQREKKRLMDELENEKKRAEEFNELKSTLALLQSKQVLIKKNAAQDALSKITEEILSTDESSKALFSQRESLNKRLSEIRAETNVINTAAEQQGERELSQAESKSKELDVELTKLRAVSETDEQQIKNLKETIEGVNRAIKELSESSEKENSEIKASKERLDVLNLRRHELTEATLKAEKYFKEKESAEKQLNDINQKVYEYRLALANYPRSAELQSKLSEINSIKAKFESDNKEMTIRFSELRPMVDRLKANVKKEEDTLYWLRESLLTQKANLGAQGRAADTAEKLKKEIPGVYGTINQLFSIKSEKYTKAILRSIGRRGDFIVVDDESVASKCIEKLKRDRLGNFNFIPLNKIVQIFTGKKPDIDFAVDYTINLVAFDQKFANAMRFVFGDTLLVDTFENAQILINKYRMVTLDGTVFEKTGVISGGYQEDISFSIINKKYEELKKGVEEHSRLKEELESELQDKNATLSFLMSKIKSNEKDLLDTRTKINALTTELSNFRGSEAEVSSEINNLESKKFDLEDRVRMLGIDKYEGVDYKKEIEQLDKEIKQLQITQGTSITRVESVYKRDLTDLLKRSSDLEKEKARFEADLAEINRKIEEGQKNLELVVGDLGKKSEALLNLRSKREALFKEAATVGDEIDTLNRTSGELQSKINGLKIREAEAKVKLETAEEEYKKYAIPDVVVEPTDSLETISRKLVSLTSKKERFGPINEIALERFNQVLLEYNEFSEKLIKLNEEKERILLVIKDIEAKKLDTFMKTLSDINIIFSNVFNSITGGKAEMVPDNPQDIFAGGLDIRVDLPNKKIHNVRGLSGGEMSILSIAILMSISKYIDVPFYVLDEVDAALDSVNSSKFSGLVKAYSENTEFIIISHNEITLLNADVIYGITMTGDGISRVVSVKMPKEGAAPSSK
jgi:chromosome segregation protein